MLGLNAGQAVAVLELMSFAGFGDHTSGLRGFCETLAGFSPRAHRAKGAVGLVDSSFPRRAGTRSNRCAGASTPGRSS